ncbi:MAG: beta strand repeat-containing protein, partial [Sphaerospermopsis kisseleviana]
PLDGDSLLFAGTTQTNTTNDVSPQLLANAIVFSNTAGTFAISGNALTVSNGITNLSANAQTFSNAVTLGAAQTFNASAGNLTFAGNIANGGNLLTVDGSGNSTFSQQISGAGGLTKNGAGSLILSGTSTYNGATTLNAGTTRVSGSIGSSAVAVNNTAILQGAGTTGALTIDSGGRVAPGNGAIGSLSVSSLTLNSGGGYNWEIGNVTGTAGTNWDLLSVTGATTVSSTAGTPFTIFMTGTWAASGFLNSGSYSWMIIDGASSSGFEADKLALDTAGFTGGTATGTFSFSESSGNIFLSYAAPVTSTIYTWNVGAGAWSSGGNWTNTTPPTEGASIIFAGAGGSSTNNQVSAIAGLTFSNAATGSYTIEGNALTISNGIANNSSSAQTVNNNLTLGAPQIFNAAAGNLTVGGTVDNDGNALTVDGTFNVALDGAISDAGGIVKQGDGTLTLGGNNTFAGPLAANGGTTLVNGTQATTTVNVGGGTLLLGGNSRLADGATLTLSTGTVNLGGFSDTVATFNQSGGVFTNGTLTATTYGLSGGTVGGTLSGGTANVTGGITLSGAINSTLNVNSGGSATASGTAGGAVNINTGGTFTLAAAERIGNSSAVTVDAGTLATATFNDTVGSVVLTNNGSITGTGTITAGTYTLNGGTVGANLGTGTATSSAGTTTLNGTLAGDLAVSGGTVNLGSADRIGSSSAVTVSSGTLGLGANNDTVGNFTITGGTLGGSGILTASTYALQGGNVNAALGTGAVTVSGGTTALGSAGRLNSASTLTVDSGQITLGGSETVASLAGSGGTVALGANTLTAGGGNASTTYSGVFTGAGTVAKTGTGSLTLGGDNSSYAGTVNLQAGAIIAAHNNALGSSAITVTNGSLFAASGVTTTNAITIGAAGGLQTITSQNFNSLGTSSSASLPTDWKFSAAGAGTTNTFWTNSGNLTAVTQQASSGGPTAGGRYNWGFSNNTNNRAVGFMTSGSYSEPNSIMFAFTNTTGQTITNLTVSFDYLRFRTNSTAISNVFYVSDSSTSWGSAISTNIWDTGTSGYDFAPVPVSLTNTTSLSIANGSVGYLMWTFDAASSTFSQGLGLDNVLVSTTGAPTGSGTLGISEAGTATFSGNIVNNTAATFTAASGGLATFSGAISGLGSVTKTGEGTVTLSGNNTYAGGTTLSNGVLRLDSTNAAGTGAITQTTNNSTLEVNTTGTVANQMSIFNIRTLQTVTLSGNKTLNNATYTVDSGTTTTESGVLSGSGGITKQGAGTLVVTASNSFTGATVVNAGVLNLNSSTGGALGASTNVTVSATLLISQSNQVNNSAAITLSGGTISR